MGARELMVLGAFVACVAVLMGVLRGDHMVMLAFGGGALFGKGYGLWEARRP